MLSFEKGRGKSTALTLNMIKVIFAIPEVVGRNGRGFYQIKIQVEVNGLKNGVLRRKFMDFILTQPKFAQLVVKAAIANILKYNLHWSYADHFLKHKPVS